MRHGIIQLVLATDLSRSLDICSQFSAGLRNNKSWSSRDEKLLLSKMLIKAADLAHPAKPWSQHLEWTTRFAGVSRAASGRIPDGGRGRSHFRTSQSNGNSST